MRIIGVVDENYMVAEFLKAEIDSSRFGDAITQVLHMHNLTDNYIRNPNLESETENRIRKLILGSTRGYNNDRALFLGFPKEVQWKTVELEADDLGRVIYAKHETWDKLTNGTRRLKDGAKNLINEKKIAGTDQILSISADYSLGKKYPDLILLNDSENNRLVLVEGHSRATAYALNYKIKTPIRAIIGFSKNAKDWHWY